MLKAKKIKLSLVGLLALLLVGSPFIGMFYTQKVFEKALASVARHENLNIKLVSYESGLRQSEAKTVITLDENTKNSYKAVLQNDEEGAEPLSITLTHTITQGPFGKGWTDHGLSLAHVETKIDEGSSLSAMPIEISSWVGFGAGITSKIKMETWTYQSLVQGTGVKAISPDIEVYFNPFSNAIQYHADIPTLTYNDTVYDIELKGLKVSSTQNVKKDIEYFNNLWQFDDFNVKLKGSTNEKDPNQPEHSLSISALKVAFVSKPVGDFTDWEFDGQIEKIISTGALYGPAEYKIRLTNLDSGALAKFKTILNNPKLDQISKQAESIGLVKELLLAKPNLLVEKFNYQTELGVVDLAGKAQFKADTIIDENHPLGMIKGIVAEFNAKFSTKIVDKFVTNYLTDLALVKEFENVKESPKPEFIEQKRQEIAAKMDAQLPKGLDALKTAKLIMPENDNYAIKFNFEDGQMKFNDEPKTTAQIQEVLKSLQSAAISQL